MEINVELLKKIKALSEDPGTTEGERQAARKKLLSLLEQAEIDPRDLESDEEIYHILKLKGRLTDLEFRLAVQILGMVQNKRKEIRMGYFSPKAKRGLRFRCTEAQAIRFNILFPYYLIAFRKGVEDYMLAFMQSNNLFPEAPSDRSNEDFTPEDLEKMMQILKMSQGIKPTPRPALRLNG